MNKYWVSFKSEMQVYLQHRADVAIWTFSGIFTPFIFIFLWIAVLQSSPQTGVGINQIIIYYLLVMLILTTNSAWSAQFIAQDIQKGELNYFLVKPVSFYFLEATKQAAEKIYKVFYVLIAIFLIMLFFNIGIEDLNLKYELLPLFFISIILGSTLTFALDLAIGLSAFWLTQIIFLKRYYEFAQAIFSGEIIPIFLMPAGILFINQFLPFRYMLAFPIEIIMGKLDFSQIMFGLAIEIIWVFIAILIYKTIYKYGVKAYGGYGS